MTKPAPLSPSQRKARQRDKMRRWILKQTNGKVTTAEGYVMMLMSAKKVAK